MGRDYRLSNFWLAKEVNKELKKKLLMEYILTNFMLYVRGNFKNVSLYI
jgi:hypothetical protein